MSSSCILPEAQVIIKDLEDDVEGSGAKASLDYIASWRTSWGEIDSDLHRRRTIFTRKQLEILKRLFDENPYPNPKLRKELALQMKMNPTVLQVWFKNQRAKRKRVKCNTHREQAHQSSPQVQEQHQQLPQVQEQHQQLPQIQEQYQQLPQVQEQYQQLPQVQEQYQQLPQVQEQHEQLLHIQLQQSPQLQHQLSPQLQHQPPPLVLFQLPQVQHQLTPLVPLQLPQVQHQLSPLVPLQSPQVQYQQSPQVQHQKLPQVQYQLSPLVQRQQSPLVQCQQSPQVQHQASPQVQHQPSPQVQHQPSPQVQHQPSPQVQHQPSPQVQHQPSPQVQHEPSPQVQHEQSPQIQRQQSPQVQCQQSLHGGVNTSPSQSKENIPPGSPTSILPVSQIYTNTNHVMPSFLLSRYPDLKDSKCPPEGHKVVHFGCCQDPAIYWLRPILGCPNHLPGFPFNRCASLLKTRKKKLKTIMTHI